MFSCLCACEFIHVDEKNAAYAKCIFKHFDKVM